jgi:hypothetical protein
VNGDFLNLTKSYADRKGQRYSMRLQRQKIEDLEEKDGGGKV